MGNQAYPERRIRAALFVDFDNIYISLKKYDEDAAEAFARSPEKWLEWLEKKLDMGDAGKRTILLRRCYLNPSSFYRIRNNFVKAGFQVVDCPSFTTRNKNGADILMVIDILDALAHETRLDEFIILSGDSDFRPLILRLRAHDRRSIIVQIGAVAPAYTAACDYVVEEDEFIEEMLGVREGRASGSSHGSVPEVVMSPRGDVLSPNRYAKTLEQVADKLLDLVNEDGDLLGSDLPRIYKQFPEFRDSHWFGFRSLRRLTEHIVSLREDLQFFDEEDGGWFIGLEEVPETIVEAGSKTSAKDKVVPDADNLAAEIVDFVEDEVVRSEKPIHMATVAHRLKRKFGDAIFKTNWAGAGSFRALLDEFDEKKFAIANVKSGVLYDPERHTEPKERSLDDLLAKQPEALRSFIPRISRATGGMVPSLMPREYAAVFKSIADEVSENGFSLFHTAKAVQDRYLEFENNQKEQLRDISLKAIRNILKGIAIQNRELFDAPENEGVELDALVSAYRENVITLCEQAEETVDDRDMELLEDWIQADLVE